MICPVGHQPCVGAGVLNASDCWENCVQEVTEEQRLKALALLMDWRHRDPTVAVMVRTVLALRGLPSLGHLARLHPGDFDILYEEASGIVRNDL